MTTPKFEVLVHVEDTGDVKAGPNEYAGDRGKNRRLEGFQITFSAPAGLGLRYMAHVRKTGDTDWLEDGKFVGSRGNREERYPLEGIAIELTGEKSSRYDIVYMAYNHGGGETAWCSNGAFCGTRGKSLALDAIVVKLVPKMFFQYDYTQYNTNSKTPPSICTFKENIYCFYQKEGNSRLTYIQSSNGLYWHRERDIPNSHAGNTPIVTSAGPCCVVFNNKLHVFFRGERSSLIYHISSSDGDKWTAPESTGCESKSHLSVATLGDSLVVTYRHVVGDGIMYFKLRRDGSSSRGNTGHSTSAERPGIVAFNNQYHIFYKDGGREGYPSYAYKTGVLHAFSPDGESWHGANPFHILNTQTSGSPAAVAYDGDLHLFYRDNGGNAAYHVLSGDGFKFDWVDPRNTGLDLDDGPSAAVLDDMLCLAAVDANNNGIMRAVHFPSTASPLKGWDCIAALDRAAVPMPLPPCPTAPREIELADTLGDHFRDVHLEPGVVDAAESEDNTSLTVSFPVRVQVMGETSKESGANTTSARLVVAPSAKVVPSPDNTGRWDIMLDFGNLSAQPKLEGVRGDPFAVARLRDALATQIASQPALRLGSIEAPFGNGDVFKHSKYICVADPSRLQGILLVLLSNKDKAPVVDDHTFTPSVLPAGSDAALYVCNEMVIRLVGGAVQAKLRQKMGDQKKHGAKDLTYQYKLVPNESPRLRAYTDKENCRFWDRDRQPRVEWSWVDVAHSRVTVDLRLCVEVSTPVDKTAVYVEAKPSLMMQIGTDRTKISFQLEEPIPKQHEVHGIAKWCAEDEAKKGAIDLAKELGETLSGIKPIDTLGLIEFTEASINRLGELFIAAKKK
jgi:hypothetical protein